MVFVITFTLVLSWFRNPENPATARGCTFVHIFKCGGKPIQECVSHGRLAFLQIVSEDGKSFLLFFLYFKSTKISFEVFLQNILILFKMIESFTEKHSNR